MSLYFFVFFNSFFSIIISSVYTDGIFSSVFTDGCYKDIFSWENSPQLTNINNLSVCLFVFVNFLAVTMLSKLAACFTCFPKK